MSRHVLCDKNSLAIFFAKDLFAKSFLLVAVSSREVKDAETQTTKLRVVWDVTLTNSHAL